MLSIPNIYLLSSAPVCMNVWGERRVTDNASSSCDYVQVICLHELFSSMYYTRSYPLE